MRWLLLLLFAQLSAAQQPQAIEPPVVRYRLRATVDDRAGEVSGSAQVHYQHRGVDTLRTITLLLPANAFRPGARDWPSLAQAPVSAQGYQRIAKVSVDGAVVVPAWPDTPDSMVARLTLPRPLRSQDSVEIAFNWTARPPALSWRRDRRGQRIDLIGWYPQVLDETSATVVRKAAFATVLLEVDVSADQVMAGTGIALCGDAGWRTSAQYSDFERVYYRSAREPAASAVNCSEHAADRKRLVWYAEDVAEVGYALSPDLTHEEGDFKGRPVHAFYRRGQERTWGAGLATRRTEAALAWTLELGGAYPWPHVTIIEGVDAADHVLPMVLFAHSSNQASVLHSLGLLLTQQVLLGGDPVFTLGTAAFQGAWFLESLGQRGHYATIEREVLEWDLDGLGTADEPLPRSSTPPCTTTYCRRTELMSFQLRNWTGSDSIVREIYRTVYRRNMLRPVLRGALPAVARELVHPAPDPLYAQLAHGGTLYDDAITAARRVRQADGSWRTTVRVQRRERGLFPQTVWVIALADTAGTRALALAASETLTIVTRTRPLRVVLDPRAQSHDWNMLDNQRVFGFRPEWLLLAPHRPTDLYIDTYFRRRAARDRLTIGLAPTLWFNDAGGWTWGLRVREDYLGRFELNEGWLALSTGAGTARSGTDLHGRVQLRNPVWLRAPGRSESLLLAWQEGRAAAQLEFAQKAKRAVADPVTRSIGLSVSWFSVLDTSYVDARFYDDAATLELAVTGARTDTNAARPLDVNTRIAAGYAYPHAGSAWARGMYARASSAVSLREPLTSALTLNARVWAAAAWAANHLPRQRAFYLAGSDPYEQFDNPFLRSRGSVLRRPGFYYHMSGGGGMRGIDPRVSGSKIAAVNLDLEYTLKGINVGTLLGRAALALFADAAVADDVVADAGLGLHLDHQLGGTAFQTRIDFPLYVNRPALAQDDASAHAFAFRWSLGFVRR